jgi:hypothetical protein
MILAKNDPVALVMLWFAMVANIFVVSKSVNQYDIFRVLRRHALVEHFFLDFTMALSYSFYPYCLKGQ